MIKTTQQARKQQKQAKYSVKAVPANVQVNTGVIVGIVHNLQILQIGSPQSDELKKVYSGCSHEHVHPGTP